MVSNCKWMKVFQRSMEYLMLKNSTGKHSIIDAVLVPLICQVLLASPRPCSQQDIEALNDQIQSEAEKMFLSLDVSIRFAGIDESHAFAQASSDCSQIYFQASWAAVADEARTLRTYTREHAMTYNKHFAIGVIKLIHELLNCLTPKILAFEYKLQLQRKLDEPIQLPCTPVKIGCKYHQEHGKSAKFTGDMGFEGERIMSGFGCFHTTFGSRLWEIERIIVQRVITRMVKGKEVTLLSEHSVTNEEMLVCKVTGNDTPSFTDFLITANNGKRKVATTELEEKGEEDEVSVWQRMGVIERKAAHSSKKV